MHGPIDLSSLWYHPRHTQRHLWVAFIDLYDRHTDSHVQHSPAASTTDVESLGTKEPFGVGRRKQEHICTHISLCTVSKRQWQQCRPAHDTCLSVWDVGRSLYYDVGWYCHRRWLFLVRFAKTMRTGTLVSCYGPGPTHRQESCLCGDGETEITQTVFCVVTVLS